MLCTRKRLKKEAAQAAKAKEIIKIAKNLKLNGLADELIAETTGLTV